MHSDEQDRLDLEKRLALDAAQRWRRRAQPRQRQVDAAEKGEYTKADSPSRLLKRMNRLRGFVAASSLEARGTDAAAREVLSTTELTPASVTDKAFERVVGETRDFLSIEYFERGLQAAACVGRIMTDDEINGTGFLVAPGMVMTNWHVIKVAEDAGRSYLQLDYEANTFGMKKEPQIFDLDPASFFLSDEAHDFALVAVKAVSRKARQLDEYGYIPLIGGEGKITIGEPVNIIQHPKGRFKQIAIRNSRLLDLFESSDDSKYFHYDADTEPGSSGSPVFNDQWEVVALHHSGVPKTNKQGKLVDADDRVLLDGEEDSAVWIGNEGIRTSRLVEAVRLAAVPNAEHDKRRADLLALWLNESAPGDPKSHPSRVESRAQPASPPPPPSMASSARGGAIITVPLRIHVTLGNGDAASDSAGAWSPVMESATPDPSDPDYSRRPGYDPNFLGFEAPLPKLSDAAHGPLLEFGSAKQTELKYHHFSVLMNSRRRLAYVAAVNLWSSAPFQHRRGNGAETWFFDPRIGAGSQAGTVYYASNPLDRGHLARRDDAAWGYTEEEARLANDDTFHWTNCSPQHEIFNQSSRARSRGLKLWGNLENAVSALAPCHGAKLSVFNGPIFSDADKPYRQDFHLPAAFWKLILVMDEKRGPRAMAFQLSQAEQLKTLVTEGVEPDRLADFEAFQISLARLTERTGLGFDALAAWDPLAAKTRRRGGRLESAADKAVLLTNETMIQI